jgi:mannosyltransferase
MRLPSALAMAGATACVCLVGERLFDRRSAIFAGLVFAVIPNVSRFAQEVRPYAMTMLLAALSVLLLLRAGEKGTWGRWIAYALSVAGLGLMQIVALPFLAVHAFAVFLWWRRDRQVVVRWIIAVAVGVVLVAPIALLSATQYGHQVGSLPDATVGELTRLPARLFASGLLAGAVIVVALLGWLRRWEAAAFATAWAVVPTAAVWLVSNLGDSYWMTRYVLFTLPGFALLAGAGLAAIRFRVAVAALVVVTLLGVQDQRQLRWLGSHDIWAYPEVSNPFVWYSDAARYVAANAQPGDAIVYADRKDYWLNDISVQYHLRGQELPRDIFVAQTAQERGDFWPIECEDPVACLGSDPPERIWVYSMNFVPGAGPYLDMEPEKVEALEDRYWVVGTYRPVGIGLGVSLLELRTDVDS